MNREEIQAELQRLVGSVKSVDGAELDIQQAIQFLTVALQELEDTKSEPKETEKTDNSNEDPSRGGVPKSISEVINTKGLKLKEIDDSHVESVVTLAMTKKKSEDDYYPTEGQLAQINALSKKTLKKEDVLVFELQSADMAIDRGYEHFSSKAISSMAAMSPNKPVLMDHEWEAKATVGKIFDAKNQGGKLVQFAYFPITDSNKAVTENILNGLYDKLSVGFSIDLEDYQCDTCKKSMFSSACTHYPGEKQKDGSQITATIKDVSDYYEVSLVAIPMQPGAHVRSAEKGQMVKSVVEDLIQLSSGDVITLNEAREMIGLDSISDPVDTINTDTTQVSVKEQEMPEKDIVGTEAEAQITPEVIAPEAPQAPAQDAPAAPAEKAVDAPEAPKAPEVVLLSKEDIDGLAEEVKTLKSEIKKEVEVKFDSKEILEVLNAVSEALKSLTEKAEALAAKVDVVEKKLDIASSVSTKAINDLLTEETVDEEEQKNIELRKKFWVLDRFGIDLGGQKQ